MGRILHFTIMSIALLIGHLETSAFTPTAQCTVQRKVHRGAELTSVLGRMHSSRNSFLQAGLKMSVDNKATKSKIPMLLDPGTKGGALFISLLLFLAPVLGYEVVTIGFGIDGIEAGKWIGVGFTFFVCVAWVGSYVFRVATKDMTYAKQLKDYENAVIAKRLEELDEDEVQALIEDIERDDF